MPHFRTTECCALSRVTKNVALKQASIVRLTIAAVFFNKFIFVVGNTRRRGHKPCGTTRVALTCSASAGGRGRFASDCWMGTVGAPTAGEPK